MTDEQVSQQESDRRPGGAPDAIVLRLRVRRGKRDHRHVIVCIFGHGALLAIEHTASPLTGSWGC